MNCKYLESKTIMKLIKLFVEQDDNDHDRSVRIIIILIECWQFMIIVTMAYNSSQVELR
jgi:hypothetical protein